MTTDAGNRALELTVERMAYGADAVAHTQDGKAVFVTGATPGDRILAEVASDGASFSRARVAEVLEAGPDRVAASCPYAGACGGCPWMSLSRKGQLAAKRTNVVDSLTRIGHFPAEVAESLVTECEAPSGPLGYRNKIELAFERNGSAASFGMHAAGGAGIVKVKSCLLLEKRFAKLPRSISGALGFVSGSHGLDFERVGIRASSRTGDVEVALWDAPGPFPRAQVSRVLNDAAKVSSVVRVMSKGPAKARRIAGVERLSGAGSWSERIAGGTMRLSAPSFFQVNTAGAEKLVELVMAALDPQDDDIAMDLYSGAGTFTLPLARRCAYVSAVESYAPAVRDLRRNLETANLENVDAVGGDAGREVPDDEADIIVVDPPRAGLAPEVVDLLCSQPARSIAYVSCDPATLARDLQRFAADGTFEVRSITPVDLFPQTFHVETVTHLARVRA